MIFEITKTSQLVLYEPTTKQVTDLGFQLDLSITGCWVFNYKESLSPIKRGNDSQGKDNAVEKIEHFFDVIPMDLNPLLTVRKSQRLITTSSLTLLYFLILILINRVLP